MIGTEKSSEKMLVEILVLGSLWGLLDAVSASTWVTRLAPFLQSKQVCTCSLTNEFFGFFILTAAYVFFRKPSMLLGMGVVATLFKVLNLVILKLPVVNGAVVYQPVINPALASLVTSAVFTLAVVALPRTLESGLAVRLLLGATAGILVAGAFILTAFYVTHTPPLIVADPAQFMYPLHGPVSVMLGLISLPLGYLVGTWLRRRSISFSGEGSRVRYAGAFAVFVCSLGVSALALAS